MSLESRLSLLIQRIATEINTLRTEIGSGSGASVIIDDILPTGTETLWYQPSKGILNLLIDGQWVDISRNGIDGMDGSDGTMPDGSVSYVKMANDLVQRATDNDGAWNFSANAIVDAAISTNTTVSFTNLQQNKSFKVKVIITNSATFDLPAYCTELEGSADISGNDGIYFLYFDCWNDTVSSEEVLVSIVQAKT